MTTTVRQQDLKMTGSSDLVGTIDPNELPVRDPLMLVIIGGATKASVHKDRKKQTSKDACRGKQDYSKDYD
jgi:hypothetical protein